MQWDAARIIGFEWDAGNQTKNSDKHAVSCDEAGQIFLNAPMKMLADPPHSKADLVFTLSGGQTRDGI